MLKMQQGEKGIWRYGKRKGEVAYPSIDLQEVEADIEEVAAESGKYQEYRGGDGLSF
jgi:hypothetical protein